MHLLITGSTLSNGSVLVKYHLQKINDGLDSQNNVLSLIVVN